MVLLCSRLGGAFRRLDSERSRRESLVDESRVEHTVEEAEEDRLSAVAAFQSVDVERSTWHVESLKRRDARHVMEHATSWRTPRPLVAG